MIIKYAEILFISKRHEVKREITDFYGIGSVLNQLFTTVFYNYFIDAVIKLDESTINNNLDCKFVLFGNGKEIKDEYEIDFDNYTLLIKGLDIEQFGNNYPLFQIGYVL